jgi:predicted transcriptional regulator
MPSRIDADTDMQILADIGLGIRNKDIAKNYGVSPSYVSKLKLGHKVPNIYVTKATMSAVDGMDAVDKKSMIAYLERQIEDERVQLNTHIQILQYLKGEYYNKGEE